MNNTCESIKKIFNQFDKNKDGCISKSELNNLAIALNSPLSSAELSDLFITLDTNNSNSITCEEFIKYWLSDD